MDVSQVKHSESASFAWDLNYQESNTDEFATFLKDQDTAPEPVAEKAQYEDRDDDIRETDRPEVDRDDESLDENNGTDEATHVAAAIIPTEPKSTTAVASTAESKTAAAETVVAPVTDDGLAAPTNAPQSQSAASEKTDNNKTAVPTPEVAAASTASTKPETTVGTKGQDQQATATQNTNPILAQTNPAAQQSAQNQAAQQTAPQNQATATKNTQAAAKPADTAVQATAAQTSTAAIAENTKVIKEPVKNSASVMETLRAEEAAKMSEKDILSSKISELLTASKGKISLVSASSNSATTSGAGSLLSGQNVMAAATPSTPTATTTATAVGTIAEASQQAEMPISVQLATNTPAPVVQQAATDPSMTGNSAIQGAAMPGVEASSANSASQAGTAARAMTQAGSPAEQVSTQIASAVKQGADHIKIQLNPAELGQVDIKLELGQDGRVLAVIAADNQESLDLLQQDSKALERALQEAGFETDSDSLSFSLNQQNEQDHELQTARGNKSSEEGDLTSEIDPALMQSTTGLSANGNLDIQV